MAARPTFERAKLNHPGLCLAILGPYPTNSGALDRLSTTFGPYGHRIVGFQAIYKSNKFEKLFYKTPAPLNPWPNFIISKTSHTGLFAWGENAYPTNYGALDRLSTTFGPCGHRFLGFRATLEIINAGGDASAHSRANLQTG